MKKLEEYVKSIPDFPEKGIIFRDVTSVLQDADGLPLREPRTPQMVFKMKLPQRVPPMSFVRHAVQLSAKD